MIKFLTYRFFSFCSIALVYGLNRYAWNTFGREETLPDLKVTKNPCWMRDELPNQLRTRGIYPRLFTYGYNAKIWGNTVKGDISELVVTLYKLLRAKRETVRDYLSTYVIR